MTTTLNKTNVIDFVTAKNFTVNYPDKYKMNEIKIDGSILYTFDYVQGSNKLEQDNFGLEMRGCAFVEDKKGNVIPFYSLRKYYHLEQKEEVTYEKLKYKEIDNITVKEDGTLISFIKINDKVMARTRNGINSIPSILANNILNNDKKLYNGIKKGLENGYHFAFEMVGMENMVVLTYPKTELILLQVRDNEGTYLKRKEIWDLMLKLELPLSYLVKEINGKTLENIIMNSKNDINKEGWVILFKDNTMVKVKTDWYINEKEKIYKNQSLRWSLIIEQIVNDTLEENLVDLPETIVNLIVSLKEKILIDLNDFIEDKLIEFNLIKKNTFINNEKSKVLSLIMSKINLSKPEVISLSREMFIDKYSNELIALKYCQQLKE